MADPTANNITVQVDFKADIGNLNTVLNNAKTQLQQLTTAQARLGVVSGKALPSLDQQVIVLQALAASGDAAAASLVRAAQSQKLFYTAFSGNVKQNLASLFKTKTAYTQFTQGLKAELGDVLMTGRAAGSGLVRVADDIAMQWRLMGSVAVENMERISTRLVTMGKQAQWVGRQMIVGVTAPVAATFYLLAKQTIELDKATTNLRRFLLQTGSSANELEMTLHQDLIPAFEEL
jgi:hypothetical protein